MCVCLRVWVGVCHQAPCVYCVFKVPSLPLKYVLHLLSCGTLQLTDFLLQYVGSFKVILQWKRTSLGSWYWQKRLCHYGFQHANSGSWIYCTWKGQGPSLLRTVVHAFDENVHYRVPYRVILTSSFRPDFHCGGHLVTDSGIVASEGFPSHYKPNSNCTWYITVSWLMKDTSDYCIMYSSCVDFCFLQFTHASYSLLND